MKKLKPLYEAGEIVVLHSGWNSDSRSLIGKLGKVIEWKPATVFENPNRNKVVFKDGSYVICDPTFLRRSFKYFLVTALYEVIFKYSRTRGGKGGVPLGNR